MLCKNPFNVFQRDTRKKKVIETSLLTIPEPAWLAVLSLYELFLDSLAGLLAWPNWCLAAEKYFKPL